jgi:hypothetical protein
MDHGLISTIILIIELTCFLPKNILIIVKKKIQLAPIFLKIVTRMWQLKFVSIATRFNVIE